MEKKMHEVVVIDGVRTAFGKAGEKGHLLENPGR